MVQEAQSSQQTAEVRKQRTRLATAKQRVSELEVLLCKIYEDNILGKLSDSRYATLDAQYEKEQSELTAEISVLEKAVKSYEKHEKDADRFIALIDKYENFDKLTIAMLNEFIEKILVHERDRKGSIQTTQEVEIYFNFVGRFVPPAFTGCAIVLIGHLNKAAGTQSTYRGLGSIDITAAVRSLLFIGKLKDSPTTRVLIHEKSSLAPPGQSLAFSLGDEKGFE